MNEGDEVVIVVSPYSHVKIGTVAVVGRIRYDHFGKGEHLYELVGLSHGLFRGHELRLVNQSKS